MAGPQFVSTYAQNSTGKDSSGTDADQGILKPCPLSLPLDLSKPCKDLSTVRIQGACTDTRQLLGKHRDERVPPPALAPKLQ